MAATALFFESAMDFLPCRPQGRGRGRTAASDAAPVLDAAVPDRRVCERASGWATLHQANGLRRCKGQIGALDPLRRPGSRTGRRGLHRRDPRCQLQTRLPSLGAGPRPSYRDRVQRHANLEGAARGPGRVVRVRVRGAAWLEHVVLGSRAGLTSRAATVRVPTGVTFRRPCAPTREIANTTPARTAGRAWNPPSAPRASRCARRRSGAAQPAGCF